MKVLELIREYDLGTYSKSYKNLNGMNCNVSIPIPELCEMEVKAVSINFPTKEVTITVVTFTHD